MVPRQVAGRVVGMVIYGIKHFQSCSEIMLQCCYRAWTIGEGVFFVEAGSAAALLLPWDKCQFTIYPSPEDEKYFLKKANL